MHRRAVKPRRRVVVEACLAGLRLGFASLGVWLVGDISGAAQTAVDGALAGRVVSAAGLPETAARVVLRLVDEVDSGDGADSAGQFVLRPSHLDRVVEVGKSGRFLALRLAPGEYVAQATVAGVVVAEEIVYVDLGAVSDVVLRETSSPSPLGERVVEASGRNGLSSRSVGGTILTHMSGAIIAELPLNARRWEDASQTSSQVNDVGSEQADSSSLPGGPADADADSGAAANAGALFSFRGIAPTQNASLLDGVSGDQAFRGGGRGTSPGGPRAQSAFSQGAVRAFRVAPHNYSAQYGGAAGGLQTTASRRGGQTLHGGGFYVLHESAWAAANPFSVQTRYRDGVIATTVVKPHDSLQSFGGRVGGAIAPGFLRERVFGFASVEEQLRDFPAISSPSASKDLNTSFYALSGTQTALLGTRGVTAAARNAALNYLDSLTGEIPRTANHGVQFGRLDVRVGERDDVSASYSGARLVSPAGSGGGPSNAVVARGRASVGDTTIRMNAATVGWLHRFSPRLTQDLRGQFVGDVEFEQPRPPLPQEPGIGPGGNAPQVTVRSGGAGAFAYGTPASLGRNAYPDEHRWQLADVVQWAPGRHLLTAGFDWSRVHDRIGALNNTDGSFTYDSGSTNGRAGGLVDWITDYTFNVQAYPNGGCPTIYAAVHLFCFRSFTQSFGQQQVEFTMHQFAGFAQDLWRLRQGLTVEFGARYEYTLLPLPQQPNRGLDAAFAATGATSVFPEDRNNAGPRLALAWSPGGGRWGTARVGYGLYFGRLPGSRVRAALVNTALASSATNIHITPATVTACPQVANQGFGYPCAYVSAPPATIAATTSANLFAHNFRLPVVQQGELTLERAWGRRVSARATYSLAIATQLPNTTDVNIASSTAVGRFVLQGGDGRVGARDGETFVVPVYAARMAPQFGPVTALMSNANATWHGLTVEAQLRAPGNLQMQGSYTWSKAIDYGAEQGVTPRVNGQFDPFSVAYDKGIADANFPQRFAGSVVWRSHLGSGPEMMRHLASGWRVSGLGTAGSGRPYSYEIFGGTRLSGGSQSINGSGGSAYLPTMGRNTLHLPTRWNVDARLGRGFRLTERIRGEGYVDAFNLANHVNATRVNARAYLVGTTVNGVTPLVFQDAATMAAEGMTTPGFGSVTSSTTGLSHERQMQFGLRISF